MRNLNEPRNIDESRTTAHEEPRTTAPKEGEVIPIQGRRIKEERKEQLEGSFMPKRQTEELRARWQIVQASFVDEPGKAVQDADQLVMTAIREIQEVFRDQRTQMEKQSGEGKDVSTEDLRLSLQRYRTFFERLLSL
jgi:hypothetical protein